jgi:pyruvate dehydrogenase E1 component
VVYAGAVAPEAEQAFAQLQEDIPGVGLLAVTSPDLLHRDWSAALAARAKGQQVYSHVEQLLSALPPLSALATLMDGPPAALSWMGGVVGQRVSPLGMDRFGQSGDLPDLYRTYRLDAEAVLDAAATALSPLRIP